MYSKFCDRLYDDLQKDLTVLSLDEGQAIKRYERAVMLCLKYLKKLKDHWALHGPSTREEEVTFFKATKPRFKALLVYYQSLLHIESRKPIGDVKAITEYLANELRLLQHFFENNLPFYQYIRTQATHLDEFYFIRGQYDVHLEPDFCMIDFDPSFSTTHDHKLAQVLASELLQEHLEQAISRLSHREQLIQTDLDMGDFDWKQTKCGLIELIYSWHATDAFGKKSLKSLARFVERAFNISLGNFYDTYDWLCGRPSPTVYIDEMKAAFLLRMQKRLK